MQIVLQMMFIADRQSGQTAGIVLSLHALDKLNKGIPTELMVLAIQDIKDTLLPLEHQT